MKTTLRTTFIAAAFTLAGAANAQTAVNFVGADCAGNNHDLFAELDAGKVIVVSWVMPCSSCLGPSLTAYNIVQSYASSNPGQVIMYVVDDYANTSCTSLSSWVNNNNMPNTTKFVDASFSMTGYGSPGMPKIVVLGGGTAHTVFFNQNNTAAGDATGIQNAIDAALATGVSDAPNPFASVNVFPNPAGEATSVFITLDKAANVKVDIIDQLGRDVMTVFAGPMAAGENKTTFSVATLPEGMYFLRIGAGEQARVVKLFVTR